MGFGILFIAYFLLLNIAYFSFTDVIAGLVLTFAFNKLSRVNKYFKYSEIPSGVFSILGLVELSVGVYAMFFSNSDLTLYNLIIGFLRYALISIITILMLLGIEDVAGEVGLPALKKKARVTVPFSLTVFVFMAILEIPRLETVIPLELLSFLSIAMLLGFLLVVFFNLSVIYGAYMRICMPNQRAGGEKKSKSKLVEAFRRHEEERRQEYIDYKNSKRKGKK